MRTYGVLENDIDLPRIWATAQTLGFSDLRVAAFNIPPFHVSLAEYDELLEGGNAYAVWAEVSRAFMANVRNFFMTKSGTAVLDSRHAAGLQCTIEAAVPPHAESGMPIAAQVTVRNSGTVVWLPSDEAVGGVSLGTHLYDGSGRLVRFEYGSHALPRALAPGEEVSLSIAMPALAAGRYIIELDCVASRVTWFAQTGSQPVRATIDVT
jgi:hypothetical protein